MMMDRTYLSNNHNYSTDSRESGLNNNEVIMGSTGSGKTKSIVEPRLINANESSYVVTVTKREIMDLHSFAMKKRGYHVVEIDLANAWTSAYGINPLEYLKTDRDYVWFATAIIKSMYTENARNDPYWENAAISLLAAEISYVKLRAKEDNTIVTLKDLIHFHNSISLKEYGNTASTNVDYLFHDLAKQYPNSLAVRGWKQITSNAPKTACCVFATLNNCLDKLFTEDILDLSAREQVFNIQDFAKEKTVVFLLTSPVDLTMQNYASVLYGLFFKELFNLAERLPDYKLPIPIHFMCDDFATGSKIPDFEQFISIFRAIGVSVTLLLQNETQLKSMYGEYAASTILNNCDTIVYMGGMDIPSCRNMSIRTNCSIEEIMQLKNDEVIIVRRGEEPIFDLRYQIFDNDSYNQACEGYEEMLNVIFE